MISINNLTVQFGGFTLLNEINFHISDNDRIGLTGKNGSGKSTLLKLIMGINSPSSGQILKPSTLNIGYLPQQMEHAKDTSVLGEALKAFEELFRLRARFEEINMELEGRSDYESDSYHKLIIELNDVNDRLHYGEDSNIEGDAEKMLIGLGFKREELERPTSTFSQGWNMRIELAKVLLRRPDLLLLDEPTNHLDIESIQWLEEYLASYKGSIVLISHDRKFLDNVTNRTVEIMLGKVHDYKVPYSQYLVLRKERLDQQRASYDNQQKLIEKTEEFIERFRYKATKSNQVQSRIKQLEKLDRIEIDEEDLSKINVKFPPAPRSGNVVIKTTSLGMSFGKKRVFAGADITVERGEKIALVGRNGEGKTTMMRIIAGDLLNFSGDIKLGHNVDIGYYAQNQEDLLNKNDTVYDTIDKVAVGDIRTKIRDVLGSFLFRGEEIDKKVAVLSGGERARLALAKLIIHPYNLLLLDEPTNHMDIRSKDVLKQALMSYDGTLIIVSHDRYFLDGLVDKMYEFRDGGVREHIGGVMDFLYRKKLESLSELEKKGSPEPGAAISDTIFEKRSSPKKSFEDKNIKKAKRDLAQCEKKIEELELDLSEVEKSIQQLGSQFDKSLFEKYESIKKELDLQMKEWEALIKLVE